MHCKNCGKQLSESSKFCKFCGTSLQVATEPAPTSTTTSSMQTTYDYSRLSEKNKSSWGRWIIGAFLLFFLFWLFSDSSSTYESTTSTYSPPSTYTGVSPTDYSLPNGTVLKKNDYYLSGDGDLEIDNGTQYDAVAKLIRGNTAIYSVYIKANSVYTITGISDGNYELIFAQGSDWNSTTKSFNKNQSYETFEDTFDFETTSSQATIWEVSLKERVGGNAETNIISPSEFNKY